jgi:V/A-type H+-transporting ATPase subunit K
MERIRNAKLVAFISMLVVAAAVMSGLAVAYAAEAGPADGEEDDGADIGAWVAIAIAISIASGTLGAGYAVGKVGSAAIGAASERPEIMGRALVFVVIAEGIAVWGLVGAIILVGTL